MNGLIGSIGIMQGRLLPKYKGRYQAHPVGYWQKEFSIAAELEFGYIEFILDFNDAALNPLMTDSGVEEINKLVEKHKVGVRSVCADYFMEAPLHHSDPEIASASCDVLQKLMINSHKLGIRDIVIPCVDQSSLADASAQNRLAEKLGSFQDAAEKLDINLSMETDLAPEPFAVLLKKFSSNKITVNYDTGNSASLGYEPLEEFACYGNRISDIHIKDRKVAGGSVVLGTGNTNFNIFFDALATIEYHGPFIMQAYRDDEGVEICKQQLEWLNKSF